MAEHKLPARQQGPGRRRGSAMSQPLAEIRKRALNSGELPHELLLRISRGQPIEQAFFNEEGEIEYTHMIPDFNLRIEAAKIAAPFFAPRLAAQMVQVGGAPEAIEKALASLAEKLPV